MNFMNVIFAAQKQVTSLRVSQLSLYCRTRKNVFFVNTEHPDRCVRLGHGLRSSSAGIWFSTPVSPSRIIEDTNPLCFTGLWYYWRIVPQDTTESCPGTVPLGKLFLSSLYLLSSSLSWSADRCFFNSGCSCLTQSSARSCCCRHVRTWTTGLRVSAIETSSRSVTCAPFVYQVSFNPSLNKQMWARGRIEPILADTFAS